jgi:hypothetical protein
LAGRNQHGYEKICHPLHRIGVLYSQTIPLIPPVAPWSIDMSSSYKRNAKLNYVLCLFLSRTYCTLRICQASDLFGTTSEKLYFPSKDPVKNIHVLTGRKIKILKK